MEEVPAIKFPYNNANQIGNWETQSKRNSIEKPNGGSTSYFNLVIAISTASNLAYWLQKYQLHINPPKCTF